MVRKPIIFGLVLLTLGGLLSGCSSTGDGVKEGPSSSATASDKAKKAVNQFNDAFDDGDAKKAYELLGKNSYAADEKVDTVILPKDRPLVTGNSDGTVKARIVTLSYGEPYFDAQYTFNKVKLNPAKNYGVFAGSYDVKIKSPQGVFKDTIRPDFSVSGSVGGDEQKTTITSLLFGNISSAPEVTDATISKLVELYQNNDYPLVESDFLRDGYRNEDDGTITINLINGIPNPKGEGDIPKSATWNASTNEWSDLR